jgi:hypothetical protein
MIAVALFLVFYIFSWALVRPDHRKEFKNYLNSRLHFIKKCATIKDVQK